MLFESLCFERKENYADALRIKLFSLFEKILVSVFLYIIIFRATRLKSNSWRENRAL